MRSVNQNHHLYVVTGLPASDHIAETDDLGTIEAIVSGDSLDNKDKDLYFKYKGHDGIVRTDFIPINQISYVKYVPASSQVSKLKKVEVTLDSSINSGNAVVGQDYVLNIAFQQFYGMSPEDTYVKTVALHITSANSTASNFYKDLVKELNAAFAREVGATDSSNPYLSFSVDNNTTATKVIIEEKEQPWSLGKWEAESLMFEVFPSTIYVTGEEVVWGTATPGFSNTTVPNSKKMADLEWFTFAERGDFYRGMGYPNNFDFIPMVKPNSTSGYDALEIHFAYQGTCEDIQKSEKDITLVAEAGNLDDLIEVLENKDYLNRTIKPASSSSGTGD